MKLVRKPLRALAFVSIAAATIRCSDSTAPRPIDNSIGAIVSGLFAPHPGAAAAQRSTSSSTGFAYVSLPPSSVPAGITATVTNRATGVVVTTTMLNGGFDPVAIGASVGDTLDVDITTSSPDTVAHARLVVAARRSPRVVRTNPPSGGHDVPLNAAIVVVFSEPLDPTTVTTGSVQLWRDTTPVAGVVRLADSSQLRVEFVPAQLLVAQTAYRLVVTDAIRDLNGVALDSTLSASFTTGVVVQAAAKLAFAVQPSDATANIPISPAVVVAIQDSSGNTVTSARSAVTVALAANPGAGSLWGTTTVDAVNGLATFSLAVNAPATGYTLQASSSGLASVISSSFAITPPAPTKLTFVTQPVTAVAGDTLRPVQVAIQDASGNTLPSLTNPVTLALGGNSSATLSGTTTASAVNGVATFDNLSVDKPGTGYTLTASSGALTRATSAAFDIGSTLPAQLGFVVQPSSSAAGAKINPAVAVAIQNVSGNTLRSVTSPVTITLGTNSTSGTLSGSTTVNAVNGVATFSDLSIDKLGTGYTLTASSGSLTSATSVPFDIVQGLVFASVSAAHAGGHSCGVTTGGAAYCWGDNQDGELGNGTTSSWDKPALVPGAVAGGLHFAAVSAAAGYTCGLTTDAAAYCWGFSTTVPTAVGGGHTFAMVSSGENNTCGLTTTGAAYCWGDNSWGQLGDGTENSSGVPVAVAGGLTFAFISAGQQTTCGVTTAGAAYCWGQNLIGELGIGTVIGPEQCPGDYPTDPKIACSHVPVAVGGGLTFRSVSVGYRAVCGVTTAGAAYCWGSNYWGELGTGSAQRPQASLTPTPVAGGLTFSALDADGDAACGVASTGTVYCWGRNYYGALGDGTTTDRQGPVPVVGNLTFASISTDGNHSCGLTTRGVAYCWGLEALGNGTTTSSLVPVKVALQP